MYIIDRPISYDDFGLPSIDDDNHIRYYDSDNLKEEKVGMMFGSKKFFSDNSR